MRTPSHAGRHPPEGRTHPRRQAFNHNGVPDGKVLYRQVEALKHGLAARADPFGVAAPLLHAQLAWLMHPQELSERMASLTTDLWQLQWHSFHRTLGLPRADPVQPHADDPRFADPVWTEAPTWDLVKEWYLAYTHHMQDMLFETPGLSGKERRRAAFWWRKWLNAVAPTNYLWTNPIALRRAAETRGESLWHGLHNMLDDLQAGNVRMTDPDHFRVGENLATTPGAVIFRNRLLEVIHHAPAQATVHAEPVVIVTPWINKFYILDLNPKKSMVRYLLDQGLDVYITSWKNPDASMREVRFDDYIRDGVDAIVRVARDFSGADKAHAVGYCIGGTALAIRSTWRGLHWNMDTTRMPYAMHAWYLRELYLDNRLIQPGALTVAGESIDLHAIRQPLYAVAAEDDHIAPWAQALRTLHHIAADKRFVLSSSGHILGIVNPPVRPAKRRYRVGSAHRTDKAAQWRERAEAHAGSWWDDWMAWLKPRAGDQVKARPAFDERHPSLGHAPDTYVAEP